MFKLLYQRGAGYSMTTSDFKTCRLCMPNVLRGIPSTFGSQHAIVVVTAGFNIIIRLGLEIV